MDDKDEAGGLERFLAKFPGMTVRDFKGKGFDKFHPFNPHYVYPGEPPWHKLKPKNVRRAALETKARFLSRGQRQAAARDPALIWDEVSRSYRLRDACGSSPQEGPKANAPPPRSESSCFVHVRPAPASDVRSMTKIAKEMP